MKATVLVVGGAGYIGSHAAMALERSGYDVLVFDNLSTGHREFLRFGRQIEGDMADPHALERVFAANSIATVMHFASCINVGESVTNPALYYRNNVANTLNLLEACVRHGTRNFVFSSTAAVFGAPGDGPVSENSPLAPVNPYGRTKLAVEWALEDFFRAYGLRYCALRYFNAAGAAPADMGANIGEWHVPETHLIPLVLEAALDPGKKARINGTDYPTPDGTCVRDYIHVCDLAEAHVLAMERLEAGEGSGALNLGNGRGYSVREIVDCAKKVTGRPIQVVEAGRRAGDPPVLVSDSAKAAADLGWKPRFADLERIVDSAWNWLQRLEKLRAEPGVGLRPGP